VCVYVQTLSHYKQESIFTVVAGVLHVGQIDFKGLPDGESCAVADAAVVATAAHVLGLDAEALTEALITRVRVIPPHHEASQLRIINRTIS
jgi:myosin heavy subunit